MSNEKLVTARDRRHCFVFGHDVSGWGTICGWCKRCQHSVWTYDGKSVLSRGRFLRYPPAHTPEQEASLREMGYTRHGVPKERAADPLDRLPRFTRDEAQALRGHEDQFLRAWERAS